MNQRLNITLLEQTVRLLDWAVPKGQRSRLIDEAVKRFVRETGTRAQWSRTIGQVPVEVPLVDTTDVLSRAEQN